MKRRIKNYISKSIVAVLLLMILSLYTTEAAVQNTSNPTDSIATFEMRGLNRYKSSSPNSKAIKAYRRYVKKYLSKKKFPGGRGVLCDINKDGIYEMFFSYQSGVRTAYKIYTYKKGKIIKMIEPDLTGCNMITYNKNKKQICVESSGGASHSYLTCYKMVSKKLKKVSRYECISDYSGGRNKEICYKNGKRISAKKYRAFLRKTAKWPTI